MLKLKSIDFGQQQFQVHQLDQTSPEKLEWSIGRNPSCDLVLTSPEVSRVHGQIVCADNAYHFMDLGSTSGSLLNGEAIPAHEKRLLHSGDMLQLGDTILRVEELVTPLDSTTPSPDSSNLLLLEIPWENELMCRCCRIIDETPDVKTFCFSAESPMLFSYKPGQFVNLEVEIDGKSVIRSYSISSSPSRPYHLEVTIKRVPSPPDRTDLPPGLVSNWLHDHLKVGDRIKMVGSPLGHFTCLPNLPPKILFISAGSGITPMMSMSRWVQDTLADCDVVFLHSARAPEDLMFRPELEMMAAQMPNFRLAVTVTQASLGRSWMGLTGRISESMLNSIAPDLQERSVYVCGPEGFMQGIRSMLEDMKFPMQQYQQESFGSRKAAPPAKPAPQPAPQIEVSSVSTNGKGHSQEMITAMNGKGLDPKPVAASSLAASAVATAPAATAPAVNFAKSGRDISADGSTSILELAEQEGIQIRSSCRAGACGACKVLTRQGKVRYDTPPQALTAMDQQAGYVLACVAYPVDRLVVEA
jgi:glycine betaine catabolism B